MSIPDNWFEKISDLRITTLYLYNKNITAISLKHSLVSSLIFLSLANNQIKNISFLNSLPNIWYIDIKNNPIEDFDIFSKVNHLGYLGVTLNKFSEGNFCLLKKLNIGILDIDGEIEDNSRFNMFIYNSTNNFLKVNQDIILFANRFKIFATSLVEVAESFTQNRVKVLPQRSVTSSLLKKTSNRTIDFEAVSTKRQKLEDIRSFFSYFKVTLIKILENEFTKGKEQSVLTKNPDLNVPEYINLERTKLRTLFNVYENISTLHKEEDKVLSGVKTKMMKFIDYSVLKVNNEIVQSIILCVMLLYIVSVLSPNLTKKLLKFLIKAYKDASNLSKILEDILKTEKSILLCYYYELLEYYRDDENFITPNNIFSLTEDKLNSVKKNYYLNKLEMNNIVLNVNHLHNKELDIVQIYNTSITFHNRKNIIFQILIKFLEKDLNIFKDVINITQQIVDYILLNNLEDAICDKMSTEYKIFLEIRSCFLYKYEKDNTNKVEYNPLSDRLYNDFKSKQLIRGIKVTTNNLRKKIKVDKSPEKGIKTLPVSLKSIRIEELSKPKKKSTSNLLISLRTQMPLHKTVSVIKNKLNKSKDSESQIDSSNCGIKTSLSFYPSRNKQSPNALGKINNLYRNTLTYTNTENSVDISYKHTSTFISYTRETSLNKFSKKDDLITYESMPTDHSVQNKTLGNKFFNYVNLNNELKDDNVIILPKGYKRVLSSLKVK
jgi:hypothetical protein